MTMHKAKPLTFVVLLLHFDEFFANHVIVQREVGRRRVAAESTGWRVTTALEPTEVGSVRCIFVARSRFDSLPRWMKRFFSCRGIQAVTKIVVIAIN